LKELEGLGVKQREVYFLIRRDMVIAMLGSGLPESKVEE
jgi:hypothetical protein